MSQPPRFSRLQGALPPPACVGITTPNFFPLKTANFAQKGGICCRFKLEWRGSNGTYFRERQG
jgi:hypothetical protein